MHTLCIAAQKGGAGKTTLAVHMACLARLEGHKVLLIDVDPQGSLGGWWDSTEIDISLATADAKDIPHLIKEARSAGFEYVFIDTQPKHSADALMAAKHSDLVVIPSRPNIFDLRAIGQTVFIANEAKTDAVIVLNAAPHPTNGIVAPTVRESMEAIKDYDADICPHYITQRVAFAHSLIDGRSVFEFQPRGKAADDIRKTWSYINGKF